MTRQELQAEFVATKVQFQKNQIKLSELCNRMTELSAKLSEFSNNVERVGRIHGKLTKLEAETHPRALARRQAAVGIAKLHL
jgi:hypothetical protein